MKPLILVLFIISCLSCTSTKSVTTTQENKVSATSATQDCSENIEEHIRNNQGLITHSTERYSVNKISKQSDGEYEVQIRWESGNLNGRFFRKTILVDDNCNVIRVK